VLKVAYDDQTLDGDVDIDEYIESKMIAETRQ
jgi:hypothetical protein